MRPALWLLLSAIPVFAQPFSAGIKAGVPLTDFLNATESGTFDYTSTTQRYVIGGMAEVRLPLGFGVEVDALYRRLSYTGAGVLAPGVFTTSSTGGSNWEFPLVLKYRFHFPIARPYVEAGVAWDTLAGLKQTVNDTSLNDSGSPPSPAALLPPNSTVSNPPELRRNTTAGFVIGAGVDIHALVVHISPEIRFTRWNSAQINSACATCTSNLGPLQSNLNQAEFLVGVTF